MSRRSDLLAGAKDLEPAASCMTGRRSNQLNYAPHLIITYPPKRALWGPAVPENADDAASAATSTTAGALQLHRGTFYRSVGAEDTAVSRFGP